jgi:hypothetical protein
MRFPRLRDRLRHVKSRNEERMAGEFRDARRTIFTVTRYAEGSASDSIFKCRIHAVVAGEPFNRLVPAVNLMSVAASRDADGLPLPDERAIQFADQLQRRIRRRLFVIGVGKAQSVAGILYQSMLKSASGAEKRHASFAGKSDRLQHAIHAAIWTAGTGPDRVASGKL